jgi:hypothetical protein
MGIEIFFCCQGNYFLLPGKLFFVAREIKVFFVAREIKVFFVAREIKEFFVAREIKVFFVAREIKVFFVAKELGVPGHCTLGHLLQRTDTAREWAGAPAASDLREGRCQAHFPQRHLRTGGPVRCRWLIPDLVGEVPEVED